MDAKYLDRKSSISKGPYGIVLQGGDAFHFIIVVAYDELNALPCCLKYQSSNLSEMEFNNFTLESQSVDVRTRK